LKIDRKLLIPVTAKNIKKGSHFYRHEGGDEYSPITANWPDGHMHVIRERVKDDSANGKLFMSRDNPGNPINYD